MLFEVNNKTLNKRQLIDSISVLSATMASFKYIWVFVALVLSAVVVSISGAPQNLLDVLFGGSAGYGGERRHRNRGSSRSGGPRASGGRSYNDICRVVGANAFDFTGRGPYPAAPICPYN